MSVEEFALAYPFPLDPFQLRAIGALDDGRSVLVAAPTGSGKTVVAEYAIHRALNDDRKIFYTTPLKALSNQKFGDFVARYGADRVGLLTGDNAINGDAAIVVMTTEVLRNMLYERSRSLTELRYAVLDEVHYLQDPYRGAVWEEVLIHLPSSVVVVCLSATISNAEEFGDWIRTLRGPTTVVIEEHRPVPLEHHYLVGSDLLPMHVVVDGKLAPNPKLQMLDGRPVRGKHSGFRRRGTRRSAGARSPEGRRRPSLTPRREEVVEILDRADLLPAIYFVFSRAGCDRSVERLIESGIRLTSEKEAEHIREFSELRVGWMDEEDLWALDFHTFQTGLTRGIAAHHAGMLPLFKETVEELFEQGLVKVVFATETLSLGINMPARTVVIDDLWKFQGERHEMLTPGEYTQLTGRAGRRGIDEVGHAVVTYQTDVPFDRIAALASNRTYELRSSFRPSYNMAVNLVRNFTAEQAHQLLNASFAQFLADRSVVALERALEENRGKRAELEKQLRCDQGDLAEYLCLRRQAARVREARGPASRASQDAVKSGLAALRPGDVVRVSGRHGPELAAVVSTRDGRPTALTEDRRARPRRLLPRDFREPPKPLARISLPRTGRAQSPKYRREVSASLRALEVPPPAAPARSAIERAENLERRAASHPCARCPDRKEHERLAAEIERLTASIHRIERRIRGKSESLARQFDRVLGVLEDLGYLRDFSLTEKGTALARIYGEADLLIAEAVFEGAFDSLSASETAATVSALVYEPRERFTRPRPSPPTPAVAASLSHLHALRAKVAAAEERHAVALCREVEPGIVEAMFRWAEGESLEDCLEAASVPPGDFVRICKQLVDTLRQIEVVAPSVAARAAREAVHRGVVAYSGI